MPRPIPGTAAALLLAPSAWTACAQQAHGLRLFVAPDGNDAWCHLIAGGFAVSIPGTS